MLLVAAVPVALFAGVILTLPGHAADGLGLFGASILAAAAAVDGRAEYPTGYPTGQIPRRSMITKDLAHNCDKNSSPGKMSSSPGGYGWGYPGAKSGIS